MKNRLCLAVIYSLLAISAHEVCGRASDGIFKKYRSFSSVFIETGSYLGDGIAQALAEGYSEVHSVELSPSYYEHCRRRFKLDPRVHLYLGDSSEVLPMILAGLGGSAVIWLDGHFSGGDTAWKDSNTPVLRELAAILDTRRSNHVIMIDDIRCCGTEVFDFLTKDDLLEGLRLINPDYRISFEYGAEPGDIMVAVPS